MRSAEFVVYVPTWLTETSYGELAAELPGGAVSRLIIAFAGVTDAGQISLPAITNGCKQLVEALGRDSRLCLAIGGWGASEADHRQLLQNWATALRDPEKFAASVEARLGQLSPALGRPVTGIDIDWEFPAADQAAGLSALLTALRSRLPDCLLTMAVPAGGLAVPVAALVPLIDCFQVMTYDKIGLLSDISGDSAPPDWTMESIDRWVELVGDPAKLCVGYPAYGYKFPGASGPGQPYDQAAGTVVLLRDAPDAGKLPAGDAAWTGLLTAQQMHQTQSELLQKYPSLGGAMLWSVAGATPAVFEALSHR